MLSALATYSFGPAELTFKGGLMIPSDNLGQVYNQDEVTINEEIRTFDDLEARTGYSLGIKVAASLADWLKVYGHIGIHNTGTAEYAIYSDLSKNDEIGTLRANQFIVPVGGGLELHFLEVSQFDFYLTPQLNFNYITNDVELIGNAVGALESNPQNARLGYGIGGGTDIDLGVVIVNTELLYQNINTVFRGEDELGKGLVSLTVGLTF
ncbi:MAG: hypothetical protein Kapaf2KO_02320 [Candidatus Kapaibacteriales bacterium]